MYKAIREEGHLCLGMNSECIGSHLQRLKCIGSLHSLHRGGGLVISLDMNKCISYRGSHLHLGMNVWGSHYHHRRRGRVTHAPNLLN